MTQFDAERERTGAEVPDQGLYRTLATSESRVKAALSALEAAQRQARRERVALERALALLFHELRLPLTPLFVLGHFLEEDGGLSPPQREAAAVIRRGIEAQARSLDDLLDLTRITAGKLALALADADAESELRAVLTDCRCEVGAKRLEVVVQRGALDHRVRADPHRLHQMVWNLLRHVIAAAPDGGRLTIRSANTSTHLVLGVTDDGAAADGFPRLHGLDLSEQGTLGVLRSLGGLGIGLAVSKGLAEAHGGNLTAASGASCRGAVYTLELPLAACRGHGTGVERPH